MVREPRANACPARKQGGRQPGESAPAGPSFAGLLLYELDAAVLRPAVGRIVRCNRFIRAEAVRG